MLGNITKNLWIRKCQETFQEFVCIPDATQISTTNSIYNLHSMILKLMISYSNVMLTQATHCILLNSLIVDMFHETPCYLFLYLMLNAGKKKHLREKLMKPKIA